ncbi:hypothetical protein [Streptomyces sp. TLI_146]|uniref:hypothetical protein n=1 Tax=Streptomyces sp. TLI_146 TaxID=1938858 RepID=UPI000C704C9E|nr:hypothetical protein [Streptomyces sp. TLI_146]PKV89999.1 hypothetical protein BX283_7654 [Streptomyces sp. TLI_146]
MGGTPAARAGYDADVPSGYRLRGGGADGAASGPVGDLTSVSFSMGAFPVTKYPMVRLDVEFADGTRAIGDDGDFGEKFRGWDVCMRQGSPETLCATTSARD